jgi:putative DNA primase/helicase
MKQFYTRPYPETPINALTGPNTALGRVTLNPNGIADCFKIRPQFVGWNAELKPNGKLNKVPMIAGTTRKASTTDLLTWSSFEDALTAYEAGKHAGIGFVFCSADPFVGIDFDDCRDPDTGVVDPRVLKYVERFEKRYVEASVSGTGVHLITHGKLKGGTKKGNYELYDQDRFFALTGVALS